MNSCNANHIPTDLSLEFGLSSPSATLGSLALLNNSDTIPPATYLVITFFPASNPFFRLSAPWLPSPSPGVLLCCQASLLLLHLLLPAWSSLPPSPDSFPVSLLPLHTPHSLTSFSICPFLFLIYLQSWFPLKVHLSFLPCLPRFTRDSPGGGQGPMAIEHNPCLSQKRHQEQEERQPHFPLSSCIKPGAEASLRCPDLSPPHTKQQLLELEGTTHVGLTLCTSDKDQTWRTDVTYRRARAQQFSHPGEQAQGLRPLGRHPVHSTMWFLLSLPGPETLCLFLPSQDDVWVLCAVSSATSPSRGQELQQLILQLGSGGS